MGKEHHTNRWKKLSQAYRKKNYLCEVWLSLGKSIKADHVDHIIRISEGGALYSEENWMALSEFWHNRKTQIEKNDGTINMTLVDTEHGKVPLNRNDIISILVSRHKRDLQDFIDGYRTIKSK